jgi:hypothetical protein
MTLLAGGAYAAEVKVENYGNSDIYVSFAFNRGLTVSDGWTRIPPNGTKVFPNDTQDEMYLRIEMNNQELTFGPHFSKFRTFPVTNNRFVVRSEADDNTVRHFRWGSNLENSMNRTRSEPLPNGWQYRRYFSVGNGNDRLEVKP